MQHAMSALCQKRTWRHLFDQLVGASEQLRWHREAERFGGFEVDHRLKLSGLHYWTTGRLADFSEP